VIILSLVTREILWLCCILSRVGKIPPVMVLLSSLSMPIWDTPISIHGQLSGQYKIMSGLGSVFVLAFVVEFEVGYNPFMHKTQP